MRAGWCPAQTWGLFFYGPEQVLVPFGEGFRCVGPGDVGMYRLDPPQQTDNNGNSQRQLDWDAWPEGWGTGAIEAGSTWNFQWWYRDPGQGPFHFNLSNALQATFVP